MDRRSFWNGSRWLEVSPDGKWAWDGEVWIAIPGQALATAKGSSYPAVDVLICFDTTGSMDGLIEPLTRQTAAFVAEAAARDLDLHWGLVAFGDLRVPEDKVVRYPFTSNAQTFSKQLKKMPRFSGGANCGETSLDALQAVATHSGWRADTVRICVLLTDEPPIGLRINLEDTGLNLRKQNIVVFCVSIEHRAYTWLSTITGGEWWNIEEPVPFDRMFGHLARRVMTLASEMWPRLAAGRERT